MNPLNSRPGDHSQATSAGPGLPARAVTTKPLVGLTGPDIRLIVMILAEYGAAGHRGLFTYKRKRARELAVEIHGLLHSN